MIKKILVLVIFVVSIAVLSSCTSENRFRINLKDGENLRNDNGFGRFNEQGSPRLARSNFDPNLEVALSGKLANNTNVTIVGMEYRGNGHSIEYNAGTIQRKHVTDKVVKDAKIVRRQGHPYASWSYDCVVLYYIPEKPITRVTGKKPVNIDVQIRRDHFNRVTCAYTMLP